MTQVPYSQEAELAVLGCLLDEGTFAAHGNELTSSDFFVPECRRIFAAICKMADSGAVIRVDTLLPLLDKEDWPVLADLVMQAIPLHLKQDIATVKRDAARRRRLAQIDIERSRIMAREDEPTIEEDFSAVLEPRRFDVHKPPPRTEPVMWVNDAGIAKPGDLVVIQAQVKSGKSSLLAAMMGCLMGSGRMDCDFLGVKGFNPKGLPVLHIDTEQTPEDHYDMLMRTLKRAKMEEPPSWLFSYCLTELSIDERRKVLKYETERLFRLYGGLCAIFLDGAADCVHNVNDPEESNIFVDELYAIAIRYLAPLISIIHENHSSEDGKTRGHLGSQLMRKAASNLRLSKDAATGVIQLWGERLRRGHIGKGTGPHFIWDEESAMHVTCDSSAVANKSERLTRKQEKLTFLADVVYESGTSKKYSDLREMIAQHEQCSRATATRLISRLLDVGLIKKEGAMNLYSRVTN